MDSDELAGWLRLSLTPRIGNDAARRLLAGLGLPQDIFAAGPAAWRQIVTPAQTNSLTEAPPELAQQIETTLHWLATADAGTQRRILTLGDAAYPPSLLTLEDPPLLLYALGQVSLLNDLLAPGSHCDPEHASNWPSRGLAIVGSRSPTPQGRQDAGAFAQALSAAGICIVSGLALGIDGAAHEGALLALDETAPAQRLATVAVIGTGIDRVYPRQHRELAHRIARQGVILSEYPLGMPPLPGNFPKRNRLIAGLSQGTLVVEAALQSGSLITARLASEQGKEVFAIPGSIHNPQSRGPHALIRQGAKLVETAQDVLEELRWPARPAIASRSPPPDSPKPNDKHAALLQALGNDPVSLDALQARTGLDTPSLQAHLLELELDGHVARMPGGLFQRLSQA